MTRLQRAYHQHLRQMAAIRRGKYRRGIFRYMERPRRALLGHVYIEDHYGNGYTEPRESYAVCTCGDTLWEAVQPYGQHDLETWERHLARVKRTRRPKLHKGGKP